MTEANTHTNKNEYDGEIDLIELIANLWREKAVIIITSIGVGVLGTLYAFTITPTYRVETELSPPSATELRYLNNTEFFKITSDKAFAEFVDVIESSNHIERLASTLNEVIKTATNIEADENIFDKLDKRRTIEYPNTIKKTNNFSPDRYVFSYTGIDRESLNKLIIADLALASSTATKNIEEKYQNSLQQQITRLEREQILQQKIVGDQLKARKAYVLSTRSDKLKKLEEAFKIAQSLNLELPSSLSQLARGTGNRQVEISAELNNNRDPLYLRGTRLLSAEIKNLRELESTIFLDPEIRNLENQKILLENNRKLEQLKTILVDTSLRQGPNFYSQSINTPSKPIKPKKTLIISVSILLGCVFGLFVAIGRIIYKNTKKQRFETSEA